MNIFKLIVSLLIFIPSALYAKVLVRGADVLACDSVWHPNNCVGSMNTDLRRNLEAEVGIHLPRSPRSLPDIEIVTIEIDENTNRVNVRRDDNVVQNRNPGGTSPTTHDDHSNPNAQQPRGNGPNGMQPFQLASKGAPTQVAQPMNQAQAGNGNPEVRNGVPVRWEAPPEIDSSGALGDGQAFQGLNPSTLNPVDINNNNINSGDTDSGISTASYGGAGGVGLPNGPGQFQSGDNAPAIGKPGGGANKQLDKLGQLAKKMGKSFFGGLSKLAGNNKYGRAFGSLAKKFGKGTKPKGTQYANVANSRKLNLGKFVGPGGRLPASIGGSEYYDEKSFMFNNLCHDFVEMARREKMTVNLAACPK